MPLAESANWRSVSDFDLLNPISNPFTDFARTPIDEIRPNHVHDKLTPSFVILYALDIVLKKYTTPKNPRFYTRIVPKHAHIYRFIKETSSLFCKDKL